jgi:hypothetical protein
MTEDLLKVLEEIEIRRVEMRAQMQRLDQIERMAFLVAAFAAGCVAVALLLKAL